MFISKSINVHTKKFSNEVEYQSYNHYINRFGEPKELVTSYYENTSEDELIGKIKIRRILSY